MKIRKYKYKIRKYFVGKELPAFKSYRHLFENKTGLEIGGPSPDFKENELLPVYALAKKVDGCNFSASTVWEGSIKEGEIYEYAENKKPGYQYIKEGTDLSGIADESYDFILSSHSLEHFANPLKALKEWLRVLKKGGTLLILVPDKKYIFDRYRPYTTFEHILKDYENNIGEDDLTCLEEAVRFHDFSRDKEDLTPELFKERSLNNFNNRCLHHHVFSLEILDKVFHFLNVKKLILKAVHPFHLVTMGIKK